MARVDTKLLGQVLRLLPANVAAVVYALAGGAAGWALHEAMSKAPKGKRREVPPATTAADDPSLTRILGEARAPSVLYRRSGENFVAEVDTATHNPRWVAELLTHDTVSGPAVHREGMSFHEETALPPHLRARLSDYAGSGYDRGHMAAAANHRSSDTALADTFYLSNICPQVGQGLNRDYWARLEAWIRGLAMRHKDADGHATVPWDEVRVITGPLYLPEPVPQGKSGKGSAAGAVPAAGQASVVHVAVDGSTDHATASPPQWRYSHAALGQAGAWLAVPSHFFKVVLCTRRTDSGSTVEAVAAFVVPNAQVKSDRPITDFLVPIQTLESLSGLQFWRERLGPDGLAAADAGLSTALHLSSDPASAHVALALHASRALAHKNGSTEGSGKGKGKDKDTAWPPLMSVPHVVGGHGSGKGKAGGQGTESPRAWHLCSLTPCQLPPEGWFGKAHGEKAQLQ